MITNVGKTIINHPWLGMWIMVTIPLINMMTGGWCVYGIALPTLLSFFWGIQTPSSISSTRGTSSSCFLVMDCFRNVQPTFRVRRHKLCWTLVDFATRIPGTGFLWVMDPKTRGSWSFCWWKLHSLVQRQAVLRWPLPSSIMLILLNRTTHLSQLLPQMKFPS